MKVVLAGVVALWCTTPVIAAPASVTVISARSSAVVDVTFVAARPGDRLRDVRLTGEPLTTVFVQRLPELALVATLVGPDGAISARIGNGTFPDGRYRVTFVTRAPARLAIPTGRAGAARAVRVVRAQAWELSTSAPLPVQRMDRAMAVPARGLYAVVLTTTQTAAGGVHTVCLRRGAACVSGDPLNVSTWRADGVGPATIRSTLAGSADRSYSSVEVGASSAGVMDRVTLVAVTAG